MSGVECHEVVIQKDCLGNSMRIPAANVRDLRFHFLFGKN